MCYQTLRSVRAACLLCGRSAVGEHVTAWRAPASCLGFTVRGARRRSRNVREAACLSVNVCALFVPAAEASLRPDWSCCTTSSPGTTTSPIVSPPTAPPPVFHFTPVHSVTAFPVSSRGGKNSGKRMYVLQKKSQRGEQQEPHNTLA